MRYAAVLSVLLLAACAAPRAPQVQTVPEAALAPHLLAGAPKAELERAAAPERRIAFASGYEVWLYHVPAPGGAAEVVVLIGPDGAVRKTRRREPP